jgi:serine/threonine protein kinase
MEHCPPDEELIAFALGKLEDARLAAFHGHLDVCATCQHVLAEAAHAFATAVTAPFSEDGDFNTTFQPGALVADRYVISRFIARGAMGEVYEAYDRELAERVALKTVASTACDNVRAVRRLRSEVQLARRVSHPNVCRIYDFGTHVLRDTGVQLHFLTMEFVEGETLGQRVRLGGALPPAEALELARELLLALRAAHGAGVLHRDFKSDNVMLKLGPVERSNAVVLDFGLARDVDQAPPASVSHPTFVGTFGYMAPEVLEGTSHSAASDVYSFGVVWFEMLTGQLPFEGATSPARALQCLETAAPAPSSFNPRISRDLDELVLRCLARRPQDRFSTVSDVLDALDALDGRRVSSLHPVTARARQASARGPKARLVPLLALAGLGVAGAYWVGTRQPTNVAAVPLATAGSSTVVPPSQKPSPAVLSSHPLDVRTAVTTATAVAAEPAPPSTTRTRATTRTARQQADGQPSRRNDLPASNPPMPMPTSVPGVASAAPPADLSATPAAASPASATPPAPFGAPRSVKPDWENPFGATERRARVASGAKSPT